MTVTSTVHVDFNNYPPVTIHPDITHGPCKIGVTNFKDSNAYLTFNKQNFNFPELDGIVLLAFAGQSEGENIHFEFDLDGVWSEVSFWYAHSQNDVGKDPGKVIFHGVDSEVVERPLQRSLPARRIKCSFEVLV